MVKKNSTTALLFFLLILSAATSRFPTVVAQSQDKEAIQINTAFPSASLGKVEVLAPTTFRCHVLGQYDQRGHNRQTTWFFFRMDNVRGKEITLILTDFVGEYNDRPGACPMNPNIRPVWSADGVEWTHFEEMNWNEETKEVTLVFRPESDSIFIAHVPPYSFDRIERFIEELDRSPFCRVEIFGRSVENRPLYRVTITDETMTADRKRRVWFIPRQHAWEAPTSLIGEGLVRFLVSDDPEAAEIRRRLSLVYVPTLDPDGCQNGGVRFNRNGFDTNRHWNDVTGETKADFRRIPEISYAYKAILADHRAAPLDLVLSLHNEENNDHFSVAADGENLREKMVAFYRNFVENSTFAPISQEKAFHYHPAGAQSIEALWERHGIPTVLIEFKIARKEKTGRLPTSADFLENGPALLRALDEAIK